MADASRGASANEMEIALAKASELMAEYGISMFDVQDKDSRVIDEEVKHEKVELERERKALDTFIGNIITKCCDVRYIHSSYFGAEQVKYYAFILVGTEADREFAKAAHSMLRVRMPASLLQYLQSNRKKLTDSLKQSYFDGIAQGFVAACKTGRAKATGAHSEAAQSAYALVVVRKGDAMQKYIEQHFNLHYERSLSGKVNNDAFSAGYARGQQMDIGNAKIKSSSRNLN